MQPATSNELQPASSNGPQPASTSGRRPAPNRRIATLTALGAAVVLPCLDAIVKTLVIDYPIVMVAWVRMGLIAVFLGIVNGRQVGTRLLRPVALRLQLLRGAAAVLGTTMVFLGFRVMPLAECLAIVSVAPVLANLFARYWLNEAGDAFSWFAALASFAGVLVIARPGLGVFHFAAFFPLIGAVGLAAFLTLTRAVSRHDDPRVTAFFGPLVSFAIFSVAISSNWVTPKSATDLLLFLAIGAMAAIAQVLQTLSYNYGTTHQVAPFSYASLVVAIALGWALFSAVPDGWSLLGMAIIAVAGLATVMRK